MFQLNAPSSKYRDALQFAKEKNYGWKNISTSYVPYGKLLWPFIDAEFL
jgi:hypothetical protein